jgi:DNA excision repair protein ERCC-4
MTGFAKVDKTLKALQVRNLYLYPRFHDSIKGELEQHPPEVEELHQGLSSSMKDIQNAIVAAVQTCMKELKNSTPYLDWTGSDLSIENCVTSSFDRAISRQLEKDWHRLKPNTKQLVQDLKTLKALFESLIQYDCVSFWKLINTIKTISAKSKHPAMWLLTPAADLIFRRSKERIYKIQKGKPTETVPNPVSRLIPVLEENPKWRLLKKVLLEIQEKEKAESHHRQVTILVVVENERAVETIRSYLVEGRDKTLALRWYNYLEQYNDRTRSVAGGNMSEESRLLLEEENRVRRKLFPSSSAAGGAGTNNTNTNKRRPKKLNEVPSYAKKRRRIALEKGRGADVGGTNDDRERQAVLDEAVDATEQDLDQVEKVSLGATSANNARDVTDEIYDTMFQVSIVEEPKIVIKSLSSIGKAGAELFLSDLNPEYIVLYDFDVRFVRSVEVHCAMNPMDEGRLKVYFLMFEASSEQKVFLKALEREKSAFERLINHKKTMPPPVLRVEGTQEMQEAIARGSVGGTYNNGTLPLSLDTRRSAAKPKEEKRNIAVDVREFRSALPSILHRGGMRLAPVTLTVGDFVLTNVHCVERKSISDLFGSFQSGRLYTQAEQMSKYYACPCLLIEFDPSKTFCLQNSHEIGMDIKLDSICTKLAILTIHFPKLRILWSKSPHETLKLFKELKSNHEEVDVAKAIEVGRSDSVESLLKTEEKTNGECDDDDDDDDINEAGRDMLLRLPGVNVQIARRIMKECDSLADLIVMDRIQLRKLAGPVVGQKLFTFFRQDVGSL